MPKKSLQIIEIGELTSFVQSKAVHRIMLERKIFLQKKMNSFVKEKNLYDAYAILGKLNDIDALMKKAQERLEELRKESE